MGPLQFLNVTPESLRNIAHRRSHLAVSACANTIEPEAEATAVTLSEASGGFHFFLEMAS